MLLPYNVIEAAAGMHYAPFTPNLIYAPSTRIGTFLKPHIVFTRIDLASTRLSVNPLTEVASFRNRFKILSTRFWVKEYAV